VKENSIEKDIHLLESYAGMTHKMNDNQGRPKLDQAIEHILQDYKRVLKENEELEEINNELEAEKNEAIRRYNFETIPKQKVKDKIEELNREIGKSIDNSKGGLDEEFIEKAGELLAQKRILQELLEGRKI
jgi:polyribonucleotide nucleotidyltransferase